MALFQADALGAKANGNRAPTFAGVTGYYPEIKVEQLLQYPPGTFRRE
ncbi:hypothetical protein [Laspinema olomoucense]|uniref:Uncharacterized protein n=1 Tax=Laspinema olomoucense D3b TaxID=2953688 RepID=A0ABT2N1G3_9CYAN|nr:MULTISPECIES: hypothetical protein [unclassified Laspinema]MCT7972045.1 hypothetical protein [Laspinema sp. D3d]MCT7976524.1 hypothetical protein [Laspinema sp. D3b]MCT7990336.1 hypothetical protein [Laspinema sp. D3a]MCT7994954.1 hypothetical protein [Laspinema sp. D3c]